VSRRDEYPSGVPCWVDVLEPDPVAATRFYGGLFGWEFDGPGPGDYYEARLRGRHVAGVGAQPPGGPTACNT
jgi:predicted enzyme related to lactoylglutathione lyase